MHIIGLTGGLSTGKSTAARMFRDLGARVIDADKIVHQLLTPKGKCFKPVVRVFGKEILKGGRINRKALAEVVFAQPALRRKLEGLIHPQVRLAIKAKVQQYQRGKRTKLLVLDIPLLFESHWHRQVDATVVVSSSKAAQLNRAMKHLKISKGEALKRIGAQMPLRKKVDLADYVIKNSSTKNYIKKQVRKIYTEILN